MTGERVEIKLSKRKGFLTFLGAVGFVIFSFGLINMADSQQRFNPALVTGAGYAGIIFFGAAGLYIFYKLFDKQSGLIVDDEGIYDNSSAAAGKLIKWERIKGIRVEQVMSTKFILIDIEDPEQFMNEAGGIRKKIMSGSFKMYGTPVSISSSALNCNFEDLFRLINERLKYQATLKSS